MGITQVKKNMFARAIAYGTIAAVAFGAAVRDPRTEVATAVDTDVKASAATDYGITDFDDFTKKYMKKTGNKKLSKSDLLTQLKQANGKMEKKKSESVSNKEMMDHKLRKMQMKKEMAKEVNDKFMAKQHLNKEEMERKKGVADHKFLKEMTLKKQKKVMKKK